MLIEGVQLWPFRGELQVFFAAALHSLTTCYFRPTAACQAIKMLALLLTSPTSLHDLSAWRFGRLWCSHGCRSTSVDLLPM